MPAGKLGHTRGFGWKRSLSHRISVRSLRLLPHNQRRPPAPLSGSDLRLCRQQLRFAFKRYALDKDRYQNTATEARKDLIAVVTAGADFAEQLRYCRGCATLASIVELKQKADSFINAMEGISDSTRATLYNHLALYGLNWRECFAILDNVDRLFLTAGIEPQALATRISVFYRDTLPIIEAISALDVAIAIPSSGRWRDPALANLIVAIEPVWRRVTNLTGARNSEIESRFAVWLNTLLPYVGTDGPVPLGLGRVDGFEQDEASGESDDGSVVFGGFLAA